MVNSIPKGYKRTEIGIIPEDWEVKKLGEILQYEQPTKYIVKSTDYLRIGFVPVLTPGKTFVLGYTDEREGIYKDIPVIIFDDFTTANKYVDFPFKVKSSAMKMLKLKNKNCDLKFIYEKMQSIDYQINEGDHKRRWIAEYQNIEISLPPSLEEQRAIARVLSDFDELIESLDKLIEKKKAIKKGAMQELLTGKKRLQGFSGKWVRKKLGEIALITKGEQLSRKDMIELGNYPVYNGGIEPSGTTDNFNTEKNTITISEGGNSCGYVNFIKNKFWCGGHCYKLLNIKIYKKFLYYLLKYNQVLIQDLRVGSGLPNIQRKEVESFMVSFPPTLEEQRAIAQILSDMDEEIDTLEKKKEKYKMLKKGAMELLLTGKVRLKDYKKGEAH